MPGGLPRPIVKEVSVEDFGVFQRLIFRRAGENFINESCKRKIQRLQYVRVNAASQATNFFSKVRLHLKRKSLNKKKVIVDEDCNLCAGLANPAEQLDLP